MSSMLSSGRPAQAALSPAPTMSLEARQEGIARRKKIFEIVTANRTEVEQQSYQSYKDDLKAKEANGELVAGAH